MESIRGREIVAPYYSERARLWKRSLFPSQSFPRDVTRGRVSQLTDRKRRGEDRFFSLKVEPWVESKRKVPPCPFFPRTSFILNVIAGGSWKFPSREIWPLEKASCYFSRKALAEKKEAASCAFSFLWSFRRGIQLQQQQGPSSLMDLFTRGFPFRVASPLFRSFLASFLDTSFE